MGYQWLELRRQILISRDKGDTLSRCFCLRLPTSISSTSSTLSLHRSLPFTVPLATPSAFSLLSWSLVLIPLFLHVSCLGLAVVGQSFRPLLPAPVPGPWSNDYSLAKLGRPLVCRGVCICACVIIKLHITAQPGLVKLIFQCYSIGSALWGMCVCCLLYTSPSPRDS